VIAFPQKAIDNSQVVREVDPRTSRDLWTLLMVVTALVACPIGPMGEDDAVNLSGIPQSLTGVGASGVY